MFSKRVWFVVALLSLASGPVNAVVIGPDSFGYTATDEVPFNWVDISATGDNLNLSDDSYGRAAIGFDFSLYGVSASELSVSSNGALYFADADLSPGNSSIPGTQLFSPQNSIIAVYWDDLDPGFGGDVFVDTLGPPGQRRFVAQWNQVPHWASQSGVVTMQAILFEGVNDILLQYLDPSVEQGSGGTVGIQADPDLGLQWSHNESVLSRELAICFSASGSNCLNSEVPLPATAALFGLGLLGLRLFNRKQA